MNGKSFFIQSMYLCNNYSLTTEHKMEQETKNSEKDIDFALEYSKIVDLDKLPKEATYWGKPGEMFKKLTIYDDSRVTTTLNTVLICKI